MVPLIADLTGFRITYQTDLRLCLWSCLQGLTKNGRPTLNVGGAVLWPGVSLNEKGKEKLSCFLTGDGSLLTWPPELQHHLLLCLPCRDGLHFSREPE